METKFHTILKVQENLSHISANPPVISKTDVFIHFQPEGRFTPKRERHAVSDIAYHLTQNLARNILATLLIVCRLLLGVNSIIDNNVNHFSDIYSLQVSCIACCLV